MRNSYTIAEMSEAFVALPETIAEILHFGGFSPIDYGPDGCTASYDATAAGYVVEKLPAQQAKAAVAEISILAEEQRQLWRAKLIPADSPIRAEL